MRQVVIGVDIGGTNVRMGIVTPKGRILKRVQYATDISKGRLALSEKLVSDLRNVIDKNIKRPDRLIGIGIGIAGAIDMRRGIVVQSPNLPDFNGFRLRKFFEKKISVPVSIENDANAFALGEGWVGAAKGSKHYCGITLGTGVGGGIIVNGEILHGPDGMAGEVGHMVIQPEGPLCGCGGRGCLEVYASATGIRRMALEAVDRKEGRGLLGRCGGDSERITSEKVFEAAQYGDLTARKIFNEMGRSLGLGLVNLINLFNPERIVIGGKVSQAWDFFIGRLMETVKERSMRSPREKVKIVRTRCKEDAGILGAAYEALMESTGRSA